MNTYTGHQVATISFDFHGEERTVDLAEEALIDHDNLGAELEKADAKRVYWEAVLSKFRRRAKQAEIAIDRMKDNVKHTEYMMKEQVLQEALEDGNGKPTDKVMEAKAKSSGKYKSAQGDVYEAQEVAAEQWEMVGAVEGLVKALRSDKGRTDAIHFFLNREGLTKQRTAEGGRKGYQQHKEKKEKE